MTPGQMYGVSLPWHTERLCVAEWTDIGHNASMRLGSYTEGFTNTLSLGFDHDLSDPKAHMWLRLQVHAIPKTSNYSVEPVEDLYLHFRPGAVQWLNLQRQFTRPTYFGAYPFDNNNRSPARLDVFLNEAADFTGPSTRLKLLWPRDLFAVERLKSLSRVGAFSIYLPDSRGLASRLADFATPPGSLNLDFFQSYGQTAMEDWNDFEIVSASEWYSWNKRNENLQPRPASPVSQEMDPPLDQCDSRRAANALLLAGITNEGAAEEMAAGLNDARIDQEQQDAQERLRRLRLYSSRLLEGGGYPVRRNKEQSDLHGIQDRPLQETGAESVFPNYGPCAGSELLASWLTSPQIMPAECLFKYNRPGRGSVGELTPYLSSSGFHQKPADASMFDQSPASSE